MQDVILGKGKFGFVKLCIDKKTGKKRALKVIKKNRLDLKKL